MQIGMLWQNGKKELTDNIRNAARYYQDKYGDKPNIAFVNPLNMPEGGLASVDQISVKADSHVLLGHVWMGVEHG